MNDRNETAAPRPFVLAEANYRQLLDNKPNVAVLPWGATEAHNLHLPHGTDIIEATEVAVRAAAIAHERGAKPIVLPAIPFGNNEQKPLVRDISAELRALIVVVNFWQTQNYTADPACATEGDHANEMETSLMLHLRPSWVDMKVAGPGKRVPFAVEGLNQKGVWTPRPWSASHPDTGSGDPSHAS